MLKHDSRRGGGCNEDAQSLCAHLCQLQAYKVVSGCLKNKPDTSSVTLAQVGLNILGVVENMSGLRQPLASMRFVSQAAGDSAPRDVTHELLALLKGSALNVEDIVAQSDVFKPTKGGAEHMAADMDVPFLGRVPLDPALSLAGQPPPSAHLT